MPTGGPASPAEGRRRLKVLFVFEGLYGRGAERVSLGLIAHLDPERFQPSIWILRSEATLLTEVPPDVPVTVVLGPDERIRHALLRIPATLLKEAREADVIVGTVELMPTYFAGLAAALLGKPAIGWVRNSLDQTFAEQPVWHRWLSRWAYHRLPRLVFVSHGVKQTLSRLERLQDDQLSVIYNPVNVARVQLQQHQDLPDWARFMTATPTVVAAGRLVQQKGFGGLIRAHALLRQRGFQHHLVILGEGHLRPDLEALAEEHQVTDSVHLPGHLANPYPLMRHATVFVLSSDWEGFGGVLVEAMACGAPVVSTDCPSGPAEILDNGRFGVLVPPRDPEALADALGQVLSTPELQRSLHAKSLKRAHDFAPDVTVPQWEQVLIQTATAPGKAEWKALRSG